MAMSKPNTITPMILISPNMAMSKPNTINFLFSSKSSLAPPFLSLHFSSSPYPEHSSSSSSSYCPSRRHEEESRNVRVSVWWDFENCNIPAGANVFRVSNGITAAVRANGIKGPIQITAFGDFLQLSRSNQEAMSSTGINLAHIPNGGKNSADRSLLLDLMYWVSQNPPPAHILLISGDRDFASILHRLRLNNYNILLASTGTAPGVLCSAASIMWHWHAMLKGENLTGKHFNQPPDGSFGSWYGQYTVPLENPFSGIEQPTCSCVEESHAPSSDVKLRLIPKIACSRVEESAPPIPKIVINQIRHILNSRPKGISISELRPELDKSNVGLKKDLFGYKKFSRFLSAMPQIVRLQSGGDGQIVVHGVTPKVLEHIGSGLCKSAVPVSNNGHRDVTTSPKANGEVSSISKSANGKSAAAVSAEEPSSNKSGGKATADHASTCLKMS